MRIGAHVSIAGGIEKGLLRAVELGCETVQIFLANPRSWKHAPLRDETVEAFRRIRANEAAGIHPVVVHIPYLPNLASFNDEIFEKSVATLRDHLERCDRLGIEFLVTHMGKGSGEKSLNRMVEAIKRAYGDRLFETCLLLENTAGQANEMGFEIEEITKLTVMMPQGISRGICIDTCHAFAAGYDASSRNGAEHIVRIVRQEVGIESLKVLHVNDSLKPMGSRRDRHGKIGEGHIGLEGFRGFCGHPRIKRLPGILETPRDTDEDLARQILSLRSVLDSRP